MESRSELLRVSQPSNRNTVNMSVCFTQTAPSGSQHKIAQVPTQTPAMVKALFTPPTQPTAKQRWVQNGRREMWNGFSYTFHIFLYILFFS